MHTLINTIIVGGGQGGLAVSYFLKKYNHNHIILEKGTQIAESWRSRWDSFTLNTPNWMVHLPGLDYPGDDPNGFMNREEIVAFFEDYIHRHQLPIQYGVHVSSVESCGAGYYLETNQGIFEAANVVIATGFYQNPKIPSFSNQISAIIKQIHSSKYQNPERLPEGAVLVVGSSQSGSQIAEELHQAGRDVYLSVSNAGRVPRRYRGRDVAQWEAKMGYYKRTVDQLESPKQRYAPSAHTTGKDGGHTINLHQFARDGVHLLGRVGNANGDLITLDSDLHENLSKADQFEADFIQQVDHYIETNNLDVPEETLPHLTDGFDVEEITQLNLEDAGIRSIIWATGYRCDFSCVHLPVFDPDGYPIQERGVTKFAGLYFIGLPFLHTGISGVIAGVGDDAEYIASVIQQRQAKLAVAHHMAKVL
jgi:putative flavoprotein involved in K+ transport